jgi:membrane protein YqaA with SNARE-associated domain
VHKEHILKAQLFYINTMENNNKMWVVLLCLVAGLVLGGAGGYYVGYDVGFEARAATLADQQEEANPYAEVQANPLEDVKTNPFE